MSGSSRQPSSSGQALGHVLGPDQPGDLAEPQPVGDMGFGVGMQQFLDQVGKRRGRRRVQVDHPGLEVGRLAPHHLAEPPQHGARELALVLLFENLPAPGQEPQPLGGCHICVGHALHQRQRGRGAVSHVPSELSGSRARPVTVRCHQMDDPVEG